MWRTFLLTFGLVICHISSIQIKMGENRRWARPISTYLNLKKKKEKEKEKEKKNNAKYILIFGIVDCYEAGSGWGESLCGPWMRKVDFWSISNAMDQR